MAKGTNERMSKARVVRLGGREVITEGLHLNFWADVSHRCMTASWPAFIGGAALVFVAFNAFFATFYWIGDQPISNVPGGAYIDYLYFSIETLSTAGYGDMHPQTHYGHFIRDRRIVHGHLLDVADDRADLCALLAAERPAAVRRQPGDIKP
jgi:inward rectifier potassium channel